MSPSTPHRCITVCLLAAFLVQPDPVAAQSEQSLPRAIIQGPTQAVPGEMIILDASQSAGAERYRWTISPELRGRKQLLEIDQGKRCQVASYGGRYVVTLAVSNASGIDLLTWELTIAGQPPCPPPEPAPTPVDPRPLPNPQPEPPAPQPLPTPDPQPEPRPVTPPDNGRFSLAPEVFRIASTAASATRAEDCLRLASECERIAAASWDGMTPMAAEIVRVLNTLPAGWQELKSRTQTAIAGLYSNGLIKSRDDIAALLRELKVAFERAAQVR